ncbi:hypothetical protein ADK67_00015 [Saccharothrix sp. NRRL B-16348]|nr:hypothetical protein ADK67_00015 [Saccharothrix sp. NRRL B-16348]
MAVFVPVDPLIADECADVGLCLRLTALVGCAVFALGFLLGAQVSDRVVRGREQRIRKERRALHEIRRYLLERHGIELPAWISEVADEEHSGRRLTEWWAARDSNPEPEGCGSCESVAERCLPSPTVTCTVRKRKCPLRTD